MLNRRSVFAHVRRQLAFEESVTRLTTAAAEELVSTERANIIATERAKIIATERANIIATERANIIATERANIIANERANIIATERANIIATERANLIATERANIIATERASIIATERANIIAIERANIIANERADIIAKERAAYEEDVKSQAEVLFAKEKEVLIYKCKEEILKSLHAKIQNELSQMQEVGISRGNNCCGICCIDFSETGGWCYDDNGEPVCPTCYEDPLLHFPAISRSFRQSSGASNSISERSTSETMGSPHIDRNTSDTLPVEAKGVPQGGDDVAGAEDDDEDDQMLKKRRKFLSKFFTFDSATYHLEHFKIMTSVFNYKLALCLNRSEQEDNFIKLLNNHEMKVVEWLSMRFSNGYYVDEDMLEKLKRCKDSSTLSPLYVRILANTFNLGIQIWNEFDHLVYEEKSSSELVFIFTPHNLEGKLYSRDQVD